MEDDDLVRTGTDNMMCVSHESVAHELDAQDASCRIFKLHLIGVH